MKSGVYKPTSAPFPLFNMNDRGRIVPQSVRFWFVVIFIAICSSFAAGQNTTQPPAEDLPASTRACWEKDEDCPIKQIAAGTPNRYKVELAKDEFFQVRVRQTGTELIMELKDSNSATAASMRSFDGAKGLRIVTYIAPENGSYILEIKCKQEDAAAASYYIKRDALRTANAVDRRRLELEGLFFFAMDAPSKEHDARIGDMSKALAGWREIGDEQIAGMADRAITRVKANYLFNEGRIVFRKPEPEKLEYGADKLGQAALLFLQLDDKRRAGGAYIGEGLLWEIKWEAQKERGSLVRANEVFKKALELIHSINDANGETDILAHIVKNARVLNMREEMLKYSLRVLPFYAANPATREPLGVTNNDIGEIYRAEGNYGEALKYLTQAYEVRKDLPNNCDRASTLMALGSVHSAFGNKTLALDYLEKQAKSMVDADSSCKTIKGAVYNNLGLVYGDLGEDAKSLELYDTALPLMEEDNVSKAAILNNLGRGNYSLGTKRKALGNKSGAVVHFNKALDYFQKSLKAYRDIGPSEKRNASTVLSNVGIVLSALGRKDESLNILINEALASKMDEGDRAGEAMVCNRIGEIYLEIGKNEQAVSFFKRSLSRTPYTGEKAEEAISFSNLMVAYERQQKRRLAVFYGIKAVNIYQKLRDSGRTEDRQIERSYFRTFKDVYRKLAEIFIKDKSLERAVQVLDLYHEENYINERSKEAPEARTIEMSAAEQEFALLYEAAGGQPSIDKKQKFDDVENAFITALAKAESSFMQRKEDADKAENPKSAPDILNSLYVLDKSGKKHSAIYFLVSEDNLYLLLLNCEKKQDADVCDEKAGIKSFVAQISKTGLKSQVEMFLRVLGARGHKFLNPYQAGNRLYRTIFLAKSESDKALTLEGELERIKPQTLHLSVDDSLRYIPFAALSNDKKEFVVEKYETAVFTRSDRESFTRDPRPWDTCVGFGASKGNEYFPPLTNVLNEAKIFCTQNSQIIPGKFFLDGDFTADKFRKVSREYFPPLLHLSTHFKFSAGDARSSYFLLGDNHTFSLYEMERTPELLKGVDLLTAAACETADFRSDKNGREIETLATLAQHLGANSVIATLWRIDDGGTSQLLMEFYRQYSIQRKKYPEKTPEKAELLRLAQIALLKGKAETISNCGVTSRSDPDAQSLKEDPFTPNPAKPCEHPYYWAPFVLYGGSR